MLTDNLFIIWYFSRKMLNFQKTTVLKEFWSVYYNFLAIRRIRIGSDRRWIEYFKQISQTTMFVEYVRCSYENKNFTRNRHETSRIARGKAENSFKFFFLIIFRDDWHTIVLLNTSMLIYLSLTDPNENFSRSEKFYGKCFVTLNFLVFSGR